ENTNTPLPYVDLVNEVLENTVAPLADFKPFNLPAAAEGALNRRSLSEVLVEVDLDAPSAGFAIPAALRDIIAYDVTRKKLSAVGFVGQPERDLLQAAAKVRSDEAEALIKAVAKLFQEFALPNTTGLYAVDLAQLPDGFAMPTQLKGIVAHDATN